ncbi:MAG: HAD family hydrolase [Candidatus Bathyarchaeia archaeon]
MIKNVLIDYDGTLHDWDSVLKRSMDGMLGLSGEEFFHIWTYKIHRGLVHESYLERHDDAMFHCKLLFDYLDMPFNEDVAGVICEKMEQARIRAREDPIYFPEALEAVNRLANQGIMICLSTGLDAIEKAKTFEAYAKRDFFSHVFSESLLGYLKTESEYYSRALEISGTEPFETTSIGDTPLSDIRPAKLVGIKTIWLNRRGEALPDDSEQVPHHQVKNLLEALKFL